MVHQHHQHHDYGEASHISSELRGHHYGQARQELTSELHKNPREFQHLLHQISNDLMAHHYKPLSVEHDRHNKVTAINFHHHDIYSGLGQENQEHYKRHHRLEGAMGEPSEHHDGGYDHRYSREERGPGESQNPFSDFARDFEKGVERVGHAIGDGLHKFGDDIGHAAGDIGHGLELLSKQVGDKMAHLAVGVAEGLNTKGECAQGPRLVFEKFGFHLPPMMATEQGRHVRESGLFDEVSPADVRPGDYGVRNWNSHVIREHGYNAGDSFIVASAHHGNIVQANDHIQNIDRRGRYSDVHFYRPNARFLEMMRRKGLV